MRVGVSVKRPAQEKETRRGLVKVWIGQEMKRSLAVQKMCEKMAKSNHRQISQSNESPMRRNIEVGLSWPIKKRKTTPDWLDFGWKS